MALVFAQSGYDLIINYSSSLDGALEVSKACEAYGVKTLVVQCNVASTSAVKAMVDHAIETFGKIDVLINNAGITKDTLLMRMEDSDWDAVISTNLSSVYRMSKAVLRPMMKARTGRIISISSVVGHMGNAGQTNYAAAKAGMSGFTKSLASEVGSRNITVNCVAPGFIDTDMTRSLPDEHKEALLKHIPLAKLGQDSDIAAAVAFLASPSAGYITGETLHVNGGMYMA
jgi:3-oxoacyl-[acyl-carrier protein] reductase